MTNKKLRYDEMLKLKIKNARKRGDFKSVFVLGMELSRWLGYEK